MGLLSVSTIFFWRGATEEERVQAAAQHALLSVEGEGDVVAMFRAFEAYEQAALGFPARDDAADADLLDRALNADAAAFSPAGGGAPRGSQGAEEEPVDTGGGRTREAARGQSQKQPRAWRAHGAGASF